MQATMDSTEHAIDEQRLAAILAEMHGPEYMGTYWAEGKDGQLRLKKAERLYRQGMVSRDDAGIYHVAGEDTGELYTVDRACDCKYGKSSPERWCSHRIATVIYRKVQAIFANTPTEDAQGEGPSPTTVEDALARDGWQEPMTEHVASVMPADLAQEIGPLSTASSAAPSAPDIRLGLRPISAIIADLSRPLPKECIAEIPAVKNSKTGKTRPAQDYIPWHMVAAVLDAYAPGWEGEVVRVEKVSDLIAVTYRIRIPCAEGWCVREDVGTEDEDKDDYGDAMTNALQMAFKRAGARFGIGRQQLYDKDEVTKKFLARLHGDRESLLKAIEDKATAVGLDWHTVLGSLRQQTGAYHDSLMPVWALRSTLAQLQAMTTPVEQD